MKQKIEKSTLDFIGDLNQHNERDWFQANKARYEAAKKDFTELVEYIMKQAEKFEPAMEGQLAKDTLFRIYRDVRFSNDKRPYKDHLCAYLAEGGRKTINPGYYLQIKPGNQSFLGCGLWFPPPAELKAVRQEIDYYFKEFQTITEASAFKKYFSQIKGDKLKTNPKGYTSENPAIELLRHKSWSVSYTFSDEQVLSENFGDLVVDLMKTVKPMIDFLIRPLHDLKGE